MAGPEVLPALLKAGGASALAIGVVYLVYREIIKRGVVPRLKQWQGFSLLCLLAILVFVIAMTTLLRPEPNGKLALEVDPDLHFQLDASNGIFCEKNNVRDERASFFDIADINLSACSGTPSFAGSRSYLVPWPTPPRYKNPEEKRSYFHCFDSSFQDIAPAIVSAIESGFARNSERIPCKVTVSIGRQIEMTYNNIRNQPVHVGFFQRYYPTQKPSFSLTWIPTTSMQRSERMEWLMPAPSGEFPDTDILRVAGQYGVPNVPNNGAGAQSKP